MTSVQTSHHTVSRSRHSTTGHNLDNNLDALLDDLQTSVARPGQSLAVASTQNGPLLNGSSFGNSHINLPPGASGYREITTTVTQETNGVPMTSRDYQIEYLNPANSVTVLDERSSSPGVELLKNAGGSGQQVASYKTETYGYKYSERSSDSKTIQQPGWQESTALSIDNKPHLHSEPPPQDKSYSFTRTENYRSENNNLNKNLNELDVLLKELNSSQKSSFGSSSTPNPPRRSEHVSRIDRVEKVERSPGRGYPESPLPKRSSSANREVTYSERTNLRPARAHSPGVTPGGTPRVPQRTVNVQREVNTIEQRSRRDSPGSRSAEQSPILRRRTPSPSGEFRPATFSSYPLHPRETQSSQTVVRKTYNYSSAGRRTPTPTSFDDAQPYRSPSPVSFPQKRSPSPARKSLNRSDSGRGLTYQISPQLSDPNSPTVITYKYTSHSSQHNRYPGGYDDREVLHPQPFPTHSPSPVTEQNPPKKLDELMASFQDNKRTTYTTEYQSLREREREREREVVDLQRSPSFERNIRPSNVKATQVYSSQQSQAPVTEIVPPPTPPPQTQRAPPPIRSVAGPPVYYPPGVELFAKKEEAMMEQQSAGGKGKMKGKAKMKYKYEKSEKSKEKSSSGVAAVPLCLPVCCAMPCVIM